MLRLSIQARQLLAKLSLPLLFTAAIAAVLVGRVDGRLASAARMWVADGAAPIYATVAEPAAHLRRMGADLLGVVDLAAENRKLRAENAQLRRWYTVAMALEAENATLKDNLHWMPDPTPSYVTGRVVADGGGVYARAVLVYLGPNSAVRKGQIAMDAEGLAGRVTEVGRRTARVLLITDPNSRIPVLLPDIHAEAIMTGESRGLPRLIYLTDGAHPTAGERVVTAADANAFPAGLPVGQIRLLPNGDAEVVPSASLDDLAMLRVFDYRLDALAPPPVPGRPPIPAAAVAAPGAPHA